MKLNLLVVALCIVNVLGDQKTFTKPQKKFALQKPKRETPISGGSSYHGPSYKYLPPSQAASLISEPLSYSGKKGGFDLGSLISAEPNVHVGGHYSNHGPKVETYIVQTESTPGSYGSSQGGGSHHVASSHGFGGFHGIGGSHGLGSLLHGSGSHGNVEYKYAVPSASLSGSHSGDMNGLAGSMSFGHGPVHNIKTIVIPANGFSGNGHNSNSYARFGGYSSGHSQPQGFGSSSPYNGINEEYLRQGSDFSTGHDSEHFAGSDYSSAKTYHNYDHGNVASHHESGYGGSQGSYSYDAPNPVYTQGQDHSAQSSPTYHTVSVGQQAPAYAAGHKGLGHFGYSASRPQALNTNFIDSNKYGGSYVHREHEGDAHSVSNAPFKPSLFLGSSHESGSSADVASTEYEPPADSHNVSPQYQPPTSNGYAYPASSTIYGTPANTHNHGLGSGSVHEAEKEYLPPPISQSSYGPPAAPENSYLPPHHK